jgi:hypothetical protein
LLALLGALQYGEWMIVFTTAKLRLIVKAMPLMNKGIYGQIHFCFSAIR